ncbi:hypothetical protein CJ030_MR2G013133 [Morella rubra]|uniref:Protein SIEVE ELEMENT OCCLUSION B n=1 Tax=Morella rubra TaxID=262757 RepID=A0A6A1W813_9ROSI|nr:hypothetical protein CJ030_MR2G013133 [Morella rubra]
MSSLSDENISDLIYTTYSHPVQPFDGDSLFAMLHNILNHAMPFVDSLVLGTSSSENLHKKAYNPNFNSSLCTLKQLSYEMACKDLNDDQETSVIKQPCMSILQTTLSSYSWDVKLLLTLAAFALDYGDFWLLAQLQSSHPPPLQSSLQFAKAVGIMKQVPAISKHPELQKHGKDIVDINNIVKATLGVANCVLESENLYSRYMTYDIQELSTAMNRIPVHVYWAIATVVTCSTHVCCLTRRNTSSLTVSAGNWLAHLAHNFKFGRLVKIDVIQGKHLLLVFSGLDLSNQEISILKSVSDEIRDKKEYEIVWIPIPEVNPPGTNGSTETKFKKLQEIKMSWYTLQQLSTVSGIDYIKKDWKFDSINPIVVVINPQGQVKHSNAFNMIKPWGMKAFPFTPTREFALASESDISVTWISISQELRTWTFNNPQEDSLKLQFGRLLSYKNESGWAFLCKGSELITIGHDKTILTVMEELEKDKKIVIKTGFGTWFKERHDYVMRGDNWTRPCCRIDISRSDGKEPEHMECPYCIQRMEKYFSYKCCHNQVSTIAHA